VCGGGEVVCESPHAHSAVGMCVNAIWGNPRNTGETNHPRISDLGLGHTWGKGLSCQSCLVNFETQGLACHHFRLRVLFSHLTHLDSLIHHPVDEHTTQSCALEVAEVKVAGGCTTSPVVSLSGFLLV